MIAIMYFSPTGASEKVALTMAERFSEKEPINTINVTSPCSREKTYEFTKEDLLVIVSPTYAGRVPNKIMPFFRDCVKGNGAACVSVVTFGNRSYDHSLLEMCRLMEENGFLLMGAAAFATRHSMSSILGQNRPDQEDLQDIKTFASAILKKMHHFSQENVIHLPGEVGPYYVPKKENGEKAVFLKAKPVVDHNICMKCGKCAEACPMGSISKENDYETMAICIKCHACIHVCQQRARSFHDSDLASHIRMLEQNFVGERKENIRYIDQC